VIASVVLLTSFNHLFAQQLVFDRIGTEQGLSSNFVNCVGQTRDGYIWVGTLNGLQRYDGFRFVSVYRPAQALGLPPLPVHQILTTKFSDIMWVMMGTNIGQFDTRNFTYKKADYKNVEAIPAGRHKILFKDQKGNILLVIFGHAVLVYNSKTNLFERNAKIIDYPENWKPSHIQEDIKGNFYISGIAGMGYFDRKNQQFTAANSAPPDKPLLKAAKGLDRLFNFLIDSKNRLHVVRFDKSGELQLIKIDAQSRTVEKLQYDALKNVNNHELRNLFEANGKVVGYGRYILNAFDEDKRFFSLDDFKSGHGKNITNVFQIYKALDGNNWMATDNGLFLISTLKSKVVTGKINPNRDGSLTSVLSLKEDQLLFASQRWGLAVYRLTEDGLLVPNKINDLLRTTLLRDSNFKMVYSMNINKSKDQVVTGCEAGRVMHFNLLSQNSKQFTVTKLLSSKITGIGLDKYSNIWIGGDNGMIFKITPNGRQKFITDLKARVTGMFIDSFNQLWVSTNGAGLIEIDISSNEIIRKYSTNGPNFINTDNVGEVIEFKDSLLAVPTSANLDIINLKTHKRRSISSYQGLPQGLIECLNVDNNGILWLSTLSGVCRFNFEKNSYRMLDHSDGFPTSSNMEHALFLSARLSSGKVLFAGDHDYIIFDPAGFRNEIVPESAVLTDIKVMGRLISVDSVLKAAELNLDHDQNSLTIFFASKTYQLRNKLKYYYKLEGGEGIWTTGQADQSTSFASLAPGKYRFLVRVMNSNGVFSRSVSSLKIHIHPAFYQTLWFKFLIFLLALLPFYIIYRLRLRRLLEIQKVREGVARDLHDDIGSTLTSINILSEIAKMQITGDNEATREYLGTIGKNSTQMMESMDDIVWSVKPSNDQLSKITARMREYTATILEPQNINYVFESNEQESGIVLNMETRRNLFMVFKEALNNISKYSKASNVIIKMWRSKGKLNLIIEDNGIGFDLSKETNRNGLANMKKRIALMNGTCVIDSVIGKGTTITISL